MRLAISAWVGRANPNNPTGTYITFNEAKRLRAGLPDARQAARIEPDGGSGGFGGGIAGREQQGGGRGGEEARHGSF